MPDSILVVVEQREGKLNRVSWETLTAGQSLSAETGWPLEAAVVGSGIGEIAKEVAGKKVTKVYSVESPKMAPYTPDAFAIGLKQFLTQRAPKLVLMPHTSSRLRLGRRASSAARSANNLTTNGSNCAAASG